MMDKEKLERRLLELQKELEKVQANGNAIIGAIEDCKYWLGQLEAEKPKPIPEPEAK